MSLKIEHKTEMGTICFFLPPSGADRFKFFNDEKPYLSYFLGTETFRQYFPEVTVFIGLASEVNEEQAKMMMDYDFFWSNILKKNVKNYKDYIEHEYTIISAADSFKSLIKHKDIYEVNPYKRSEFPGLGQYGANAFNKWCEAESRTGPWLVLFNPN